MTTSDAIIDTVFFAQTHVQKPDQPYFRLVGNRDALIKVHVLSPTGARAPVVAAVLSLDGKTKRLILEGPEFLPNSLSSDPGKVVHQFSDSFTALVPASWVRRGLSVSVTANGQQLQFENLNVGAPTIIEMTVLDIHYFDCEDADYPPNYVEELMVKRPVAALKVQRIPRILFKELVIPPRAGFPSVRCTCTKDYLVKTGSSFNGKQAAATQWMCALQRAGGQYRLTLYYISIANVQSGGEAWDFGGVGKLGRFPLMHHELGHSFNVSHLCNEPDCPYIGVMYGIKPPYDPNSAHVGPTWGFDPRTGLPGAEKGKQYFISPTVPVNTLRGTPGTWKNDPQGGSSMPYEPGHLLTMYSDWCLHRMQAYAEGHVARWSDVHNSYVTWNDETADYSKVLDNNGVDFPIERNVEVYSVMASVSAVTEEANFVYPAIGPYISGLIRVFDPNVAEDRKEWLSIYGEKGRCDISLRIEQGGRIKTFMLPMEWRPEDNPLNPRHFQTSAVNIPVCDGKVTKAQLLLTPDAAANGIPIDPTVLYGW